MHNNNHETKHTKQTITDNEPSNNTLLHIYGGKEWRIGGGRDNDCTPKKDGFG